MNIKTVEDLFIHLLSDTYSAEKQLTKALPKLARATSNEKLSQAFQSHLEETQGSDLNVLIRSSNLNLALN
ncbi:Protein YciF [Salmonella enterica subsp. arizonae]|uniref:Protein YciF n=1 Tax=Salmonella enterica subsp. arizonae TaxID=59203 RepID=A0A379TAA9_SALER|nr:Protein YciF [Salmonella enterica subsp. arizonae]